MAYETTFYNQFIALIGAACPEVLAAGGIRRRITVKRRHFDWLVTNGKLPYIRTDSPTSQLGAWAKAAIQHEVDWELLYVRAGAEDVDGLTARLEVLRDAMERELRTRTLTVGQVYRVGRPTISDQLPEEARTSEKKFDVLVGRLVVVVLLGQGGNV